MEMIKTQDLAFTYPGTEDQVNTRALRGVDVTIERGSFVVILGHNGSGKSTLAKTFNAVLLPSGGKVYVEGMDTMDESLLLEIRRRVGMVFQNPDNQIVANVVEEDVAFAPENLGVPSAEIRKRVDDALEAVGMTQFVKHAPHLLSGGQKQRIAIAGVLAMKPECIVLDEATAMLDPIGRREVLAAVEKLNREQGITVVLITHHMNEAEHADRVIVMNDGLVVMDGKPREVFTRKKELEDIGLAVPDTVSLLFSLREAGMDVPVDAITVEECADAIAKNFTEEDCNLGRDHSCRKPDAHLRRGHAVLPQCGAGYVARDLSRRIFGHHRPHGQRQIDADPALERPAQADLRPDTSRWRGHLVGPEENSERKIPRGPRVPVSGIPAF